MLFPCKSHKLVQLGKEGKTQLREQEEERRREERALACIHHRIRHLRIYTATGCFQHSTIGEVLTSQSGLRHAVCLSFLRCFQSRLPPTRSTLEK